ncbi:hypothetical protein K1719_026700 [Acacia pycnantha]|nr:hypothetical protein K1719_026700 [Acacia pycnantha]
MTQDRCHGREEEDAVYRESARRSQMKKQKQLEDLTNEISRLQSANSLLVQNIKEKEDAYNEIESNNTVLRAQTMELFEDCVFDSMLEIPITTSDFVLH